MSERRLAGRPVVGVVTDSADIDGVKTNFVRSRYLDALTQSAGVTPLLLGTGLSAVDVELLVERLDGVLLTGAVSNVRPGRYSQAALFDDRLLDTERDDLAFSAIRAVLKNGKPLLGICRGLHELNVAFGGTLHQSLRNVPGMIRHHEDLSLPRNEQYRPAHPVSVTPSGILRGMLLDAASIEVNSLHGQGIATLGEGLVAEAIAPDGLIEAISVIDAKAPVVAVQWHLEWFHETDSVSHAILKAFGESCQRTNRRGNGAEVYSSPMVF
jgi:putative glutamine amidotransferase